MNKLSKIHLAYPAKDERYAAKLEALYLNQLPRATQRALVLAGESPVTVIEDSTVLVILLSTEAVNDKSLQRVLQHYAQNGHRPVVGVLLHDHPNFATGVADPRYLPKAFNQLMQQQRAALYSWSNQTKDIQQWVATALGSQSIRA